MKRYALLGCALALVGAVAFVAGRATAPVRTTERVVTVEGKSETIYVAVKQAASQQQAAATDKGKVVTRIERFSRKPQPAGCPPCEEVVVREEQKDLTKSSTKAETSSESAASHARVETIHTEQTKVVEGSGPRWSAGARLGLDISGRLRWDVEASARVVGPVWLGLWVDPSSKAGGALARVTW